MTDIQTVIAYAKRFAKAARQDGWTKDASELEKAIQGAAAELKRYEQIERTLNAAENYIETCGTDAAAGMLAALNVYRFEKDKLTALRKPE
jgi:hypothetical protein